MEPKLVPININDYPELGKLFDDEAQRPLFKELASGALKVINDLVAEGRHTQAQELFKMPLPQLMEEVMKGFLDVKEILAHHSDPDINVMLYAISGDKEHPLHSALVEEYHTNANNEHIDFKQKFGVSREEFNTREYISSLMFFSWYCSLGDLASFLSGGNYKGLDNLKDEYFLRKLAIQPALKYQADNGVMVGKVLKGTGFFDVEIPASEVTTYCYACKSPQSLIQIPETFHKGCKRCYAGYKGD